MEVTIVGDAMAALVEGTTELAVTDEEGCKLEFLLGCETFKRSVM